MPSAVNLWLDIFIAVACGLGGFGLGRGCSRLRPPWWWLGYSLPLAVVLIFGAANYCPAWLASVPPLLWLVMGHKKFLILGFAVAMLLATPLSRLPRKRDHTAICLLIGTAVFGSAVWPFLAPMFNRSRLAHLQTSVDLQGVCRQSTDYTCGPAAAVTALHKLGLSADEGELAILSGTSATTGTPPDLLAEALRQKYGKDGLIVDYRFFKNVEELRQAGLTLAVVRFSFLVDHYVTVLNVNNIAVKIGDPLNGIQTLSREDFQNEWRFCGIALKRTHDQ